MLRHLFLASIITCAATTAHAQGLQQTAPPRDRVEIGGLNYSFDAGISPWRGAVVRTEFVRGPKMIWNGEAVAEHRFGEPSFAYKLQHTANLGAWITRVAARTSNGGFYNPKYRADVTIGRKLPPRRKVVLLVSGFFREVRDGHQDMAAIVEAQVYFSRWLIAQGGVRFQLSNPGEATSRYHDAALTIGRHGKATLLLHAAMGSEAYQIIDPLVIYTNFDSRMGRVAWRQWLTRTSGLQVSGSWYNNPYYTRTGVEVSLFFGFNAAGRR
ncbi:MAG: YaiO family outer membrane beta-barrel protein [Rhodothermales bacterium]|nr:YaiO family outer membrane beta-barrel protein [Rhodothermales bacterium]MBO6778191.1 YaiO family outer membrane beta-barrel protein [Rhodothermales bacterium]